MDNLMKAVICTQYGDLEVLQLQKVKKPIPNDDQLLIKVHACAVTTAGMISRRGTPFFTRIFSGLKRPKNTVLGMEFSGTVAEMGKQVRGFFTGQSVYGITGISMGANAEYLCVSKDGVIAPKPVNLNHSEAVSLVEGGLTAIHFLKNKAQIKRGEHLLVHGASGSIGTAAIQLSTYYGATVTAVCSTGNIELVKRLGSDQVIDYTQEQVLQNEVQYDIIFDTLGKLSFHRCKPALRAKGRYLNTNSPWTMLQGSWTALFNRKKAVGSATYLRPKSALRADLCFLTKLIELDYLKPVIDKSYPLERMTEAHAYVETGRKRGNVVVTLL